MKIFSFAVLVKFVLFPLLVVPTVGSFSSESTQHDLHSAVDMTLEEDVTSARATDTTVHGISRVLKKKAKGTAKEPKRGKVSKSAKGSASPSFQPTSPPTDDPCASISTANDALLALKAGFTNGDDKLTDWIDSTDPCEGDTSNWSYITCNSSGEVTGIGLHSKALTGTISPLIACPTTLVSSLTTLWFFGNSLTGSIPKELGALTSLTTLDFNSNSLTGSIPKELGALTSLTGLVFFGNSLTGEMPDDICALRNDATPPGSLQTLFADNCGSAPEVECTCCNTAC